VGEIRIGCSETLLHGLLPAVIERLTERYPRLHFHIVQAPMAPLFEALRSRTLDIVIMRMNQAPESDLEKARLFDDPVSVVAGVKSPWAKRSRITLAELAGERWSLMPEDAIIGEYLAGNFRAQGLKYPELGVKCTSLQMHVSMLQTGRYLSVLPGSFLSFSNARGTIKTLPVRLEGRPPPVGYAMLKNRTASPMTKIFIEALRAMARRTS
jgi:DNA-binding transcriptional LysR family regulator